MPAQNARIFTRCCVNCNEPFQSTCRNGKYCNKPECRQARHREEQRRHYYNSRRTAQTYKKPGSIFRLQNRQCTYEDENGLRCKSKTGKNYFFCPVHHSQVNDYGMAGA